MAICKLPALLVNQIAAGEVIERPASAVKELIENSLDAGATRIDITIEDGGRRLIRVSDNGVGVQRNELALALTSHATSKLAAANELAAIGTLGFRGEALASIASVARVRLTSRPTVNGKLDEAGFMIEAEGEKISDPAPLGCAGGTVVQVHDLFFNMPPRRKFLRSSATEFGHICQIVTRIAMAWHRVAFTLTHNQRPSIQLPSEQSRADRCIDLLGNDLRQALLEFEEVAPGDSSQHSPHAKLWGLAGLPSIARSSSKFQYICLNGRPVRDRNIAHAVKESYRGLIPHDRQPVVVLMIDINPACVDVNVHPTKSEVRFREPGQVHGMVLSAMRQRLLGADLTPSITVAPSASPLPSVSQHHTSSATGEYLTPSTFVDYLKRMDPTQKGFVYREVKQAMAQEQPESVEADAPALPVASPLALRGVLQVHKSYLVTQDDQGLLIVDQHALHERVMFEELRQRVLGEGKSLESQRLLMPATIQASAAQIALLEPLGPLLERIGMEAEPMGPSTIAIHAFPSFLFDRHVEPEQFLGQLLERAEDGQFGDQPQHNCTLDEAVLHEVLDMMACKAAVKAGDQLAQEELIALMAQRDEIERSSNCPHGRPTTVRLTLHDLEKHFKRT